MSTLDVHHRSYLAAPAGGFWQWADNGTALAWRDGRTIAFRDEVEAVLARLAPQGLPPLGAVALLLAATQPSWSEQSRRWQEQLLLSGVVTRGVSGAWAAGVFGMLGVVASLPADLRGAFQAKAALVELVLEDASPRLSPQDSAIALEALRSEGPPLLPGPPLPSSAPMADLVEALGLVSRGLPRVDEGAIRLRMKTGLETLPAPADTPGAPPLSISEQARRLIAELAPDEELGGVARLASRLMAALTLPRAISQPDELPQGGVSDIANRGPLDRLLVSELAHDDLTLAVRVAVGEALYLRRETPPKTPPQRRVALVDTGLRLWGVPRVYAAATALALLATADRRGEAEVFYADGEALQPVALATKAGLEALLAALSPDLHVGAALPALLAAAHRGGMASELVVITSEEALADREFLAALEAAEAPAMFLATVDRQGRFRLVLRTRRGQKLLREARLDLDAILASPRRAAPLIERRRGDDWPAIFHASPFPLLLPHQVDPAQVWPVGEFGLLTVTNDHRLMRWTSRTHGARQLSQQVRPRKVLWHNQAFHGEKSIAVLGGASADTLRIVQVDLADGACRVTPLEAPSEPVVSAFVYGGVVVVVGRTAVSWFELQTGRRLGRQSTPRVLVCHGRCCLLSDGWHAFGYDGSSIRLERIPIPPKIPRSGPFLAMFECRGVEGPLAITYEGHLAFLAQGKVATIDHRLAGPSLRLLGVSHDGHRLALEGRSEAYSTIRERRLIYPLSLRVAQCPANVAEALAPEAKQRIRPRQLRTRFVSACVDSEGRLCLISHSGNAVRLAYSGPRNEIVLEAHSRIGLVALRKGFRPFERVEAPEGAGYKLHVAQWPDGSKVWLDSRGLAHLQSSDRSIPEATVVLVADKHGVTAGWRSDGQVWGGGSAAYFHHQGDGASPLETYVQILEPFVRRLA